MPESVAMAVSAAASKQRTACKVEYADPFHCVLQIIEKGDIVYAWRERVLDLFDGAARKNKMFDS